MSDEIENEELESPSISAGLLTPTQDNIAQAVSSIAMGEDLQIGGDNSGLGTGADDSFTMEVDQGETIHVHDPNQDNEDNQNISGENLAMLSVLDGANLNLQSLISQMQQGTNTSNEGVQVVTLNPSDLAAFTQATLNNKFLQLVPSSSQSDQLTWTLGSPQTGQADSDKSLQLVNTDTKDVGVPSVLQIPNITPAQQKILSGYPEWATRLHDCQQIGDSFRGWVENEVQLDLLLTYHKQQTSSLWGTRQSPSPGKPSSRLMWKSQYVPFDGIPFVNSGSRAIVMECQFGPRRKGNAAKKTPELLARPEYKQTCPARIYIKKVRKFPIHRVDINLDKKDLKNAMDTAFMELRSEGTDGGGEERFYVQLPTEKAHEFHLDNTAPLALAVEEVDDKKTPQRLHPKVAQKIRDLVSTGETRLYVIRKALRRFVERDLFSGPETPERHNLAYFPTVHDLQNHMYQAVRDIENGTLPIKTKLMTSVMSQLTTSLQEVEAAGLWPQSGADEALPRAETVTVTLTQDPGGQAPGGSQHVISKVETHLSDGSTQISSTLAPETAHLLSKLHPNVFSNAAIVQLPTTQPQLISVVPVTENSEDGEKLNAQNSLVIPASSLVTTGADHTDLSSLVLQSTASFVKLEDGLIEGDQPHHHEPGEIVRSDNTLNLNHSVTSADTHLSETESSQLSDCLPTSSEYDRIANCIDGSIAVDFHSPLT